MGKKKMKKSGHYLPRIHKSQARSKVINEEKVTPEEEQKKTIESDLEKMLVFENGKIFVRRSFEFDSSSSSILLNPPKKFDRNSLWISTDSPNLREVKENKKDRIITRIDWIEVEEKKKVDRDASQSFESILAANIGREVIITKKNTVDHNQIGYEGIIKLVEGRFCVLEDKNTKQFVTFQLIDIEKIESKKNLNYQVSKIESESIEKILVSYNKDILDPKQPIKGYLNYLSDGIAWRPQYKLFLDMENRKCNLQMQAILSNYHSDIKCAEFVLAGGYSSETSVLSSKSKFTKKKYSGESEVGSKSKKEKEIKDTNCHYAFKDLEIKKDAKLLLPVFDVNSSFTEAYSATLVEKKKDLQADHVIRITNSSDYNWARGEVFLSSFGQMYGGKTVLPKASINGISEILLETTKNIKISYSQTVKNTDEKKDFTDYIASKIIITGKVEISNFLSSAIKLLLKHKFVGKFEKSDLKQSKLEEKFNEHNDDVNLILSFINWEIDLEGSKNPKNKVEFQFSYSKWVKQKKKIEHNRRRNYNYDYEEEGEEYGEEEE